MAGLLLTFGWTNHRPPYFRPMKFSDIPQRIGGGNYQVNIGLDGLEKRLTNWENDDYYALQLVPDFQRGHVWTPQQQTDFVEYFLSGGKSGLTIYFNKPSWQGAGSGPYAYDDFVCVDGLQRLTALRGFMHNEVRAYGQLYAEFGQEIGAARNSESLVFNINSLQTRAEVLTWYLQMNSGGTPHTVPEIARVQVLLAQERGLAV